MYRHFNSLIKIFNNLYIRQSIIAALIIFYLHFVHSGLEPAWTDEVNQDTGELFYVEASSSHNPSTLHNDVSSDSQSGGGGKTSKKKKSPLPIPKLMRKKKEEKKLQDMLDQSKRTSLKRNSFLGKTGSIKEVCLMLSTVNKKNDSNVSRTSGRLEACLGIVGAGIPLSSTHIAVNNGNNKDHHQNGNGPNTKHEGILVKGLLPSGSAIKSGEIDIGKL